MEGCRVTASDVGMFGHMAWHPWDGRLGGQQMAGGQSVGLGRAGKGNGNVCMPGQCPQGPGPICCVCEPLSSSANRWLWPQS